METRFQKANDNWRFEREAEAREAARNESEAKLFRSIAEDDCFCHQNGGLFFKCRNKGECLAHLIDDDSLDDLHA